MGDRLASSHVENIIGNLYSRSCSQMTSMSRVGLDWISEILIAFSFPVKEM